MKRHLFFSILIAAFLLPRCYREAYYVSPFDANNSTYHTIPLRSDSVKSAWFVSGAVSLGSANFEDGAKSSNSDGIFDFHTNIYRTHNLGFVELYYGIDLSLGNYLVSRYDSVGNSNSVNYREINKSAGNKFFGGIGYNGGFAFVIPLVRSEWRIGAEISSQNEFGYYLSFRNRLPDSAATFIIRNSSFTTLNWWSEFSFKTKNGSWGFKLTNGEVLTNQYGQLTQSFDAPSHHYNIGSFTFQYSNKKYTGYIMFMGSPLTIAFQCGLNFRIAIKSKMTPVSLY